MKLNRRANGKGTVVHLSGNRAKPYLARITIGFDIVMKPIYYTLDSFEDELSALVCLENYHKAPYPLKIKKQIYDKIKFLTSTPYDLVPVDNIKSNIHRENKTYYTFKQVFEEMKEKQFPSQKEIELERTKHIKPQSKYSYNNARGLLTAFNNSTTLYDKIYAELTASDFTNCISSLETGTSSKNTMIRLFKALDKYAYAENIVNKKYSEDIKFESAKSTRTPFTYEQIEYLWNIKATDEREEIVRDILLLANYTGCRAEELLFTYNRNIHLGKDYFITGLKTEAGKDRQIPIHLRIKPIIEKYYNTSNEFLFMYNNKKRLNYYMFGNYYRINFIDKHPFLFGKTAHCGRHSLETELQKLNVKSTIINSILGHKNGNVADDVYNHVSIEEKIEAINLVEYKETKIFVLNDKKRVDKTS